MAGPVGMVGADEHHRLVRRLCGGMGQGWGPTTALTGQDRNDGFVAVADVLACAGSRWIAGNPS